MKFLRVSGTDELVTALVGKLTSCLNEAKKVLWLIPGGSNIEAAIRVMSLLPEENLNNLTIMLSDERYGAVYHPDSNYYQFMSHGFKPKAAVFQDLLEGDSIEVTVKRYEQIAESNFNNADEVIGFFGMGADGHMAGILPGSPATVAGSVWAAGYDAGRFKRMTLTPFAISHVGTAYVGAFGAEKKGALDNLCSNSVSVAEQPTRILCHLPEVFIFNDQIGDNQ